MPLEGLEEEGLPKIPDLKLVQLKFLLTVEDGLGVDKAATWRELLEAMTKDGKKKNLKKKCIKNFFIVQQWHLSIPPFVPSLADLWTLTS